MRWIRKPRFLLVYPLAAWLVWAARTTEWSLRAGLLLALIGEAIRLWADGYVGHLKVNVSDAAKSGGKIGHLITGGPYAYVRHPLYVGTLLIGLGFCVAVQNAWAALGALLLFATVYRRKALEEEAVIRAEWNEEHEAYCRDVPRWLPRLRPYSRPYGRWSWAGLKASKEPKTLVWILVCFLLLYLREELWQERDAWAGPHHLKFLIVLGCLVFLIASDGLFELWLRQRPRSTTPTPST